MESPLLAVAALALILLLEQCGGYDLGPGDQLLVGQTWASSNKQFAAGFYKHAQETKYNFSVSCNSAADRAVVWTLLGNENQPVRVGAGAQLVVQNRGVFIMEGNKQIWSLLPQCSEDCVGHVAMSDDGNLVVTSKNGSLLWQSFATPTDTLLANQQLVGDQKLSSGKYQLLLVQNGAALRYGDYMDHPYWSIENKAVEACLNDDGSLVYKTPCTKDASLKGSSQVLNLSSSGVLTFYDATGNAWNRSDDNSYRLALDYGSSALRRLKLDSDGNLRIYSLAADGGSWTVVWQALLRECDIFGACGPFGLCTYRPRRSCSCPPGFHPLNPEDVSQGCTRAVPLDCTGQHTFVEILRLDFFYNDYGFLGNVMSAEDCKAACSSDCKCLASVYKYDGSGLCFMKGNDGRLFNGQQTPGQLNIAFLKVASGHADVVASTYSTDDPFVLDVNATNVGADIYIPASETFASKYLLPVLVALAVAQLVVYLAIAAVGLSRTYKRLQRMWNNYKHVDIQGTLTRFSYDELLLATKHFTHVLGRGGFGTVYMGLLPSKVAVAVKRLEVERQGEVGQQQFKTEVQTIARLRHINLVRLLGYCMEGSHRLLVYEYMPNGSLKSLVLRAGGQQAGVGPLLTLPWETRMEIALGVAKGVAYLHDECQASSVVHCDIKPDNILLDEKFCPKVADFGLAKLVTKDQAAMVTTIRGTRGYIAPEWLSVEVPALTPKVDVYSFGMVLLEMISGRPKFDFTSSALENDRWDVPTWAYQRYLEGDVRSTVDPLLGEHLNWAEVERLLKIAFWCIQSEPEKRPTMGSVVQMISGTAEVEQPPAMTFS